MEYKPVDFAPMEGHAQAPWRLTQEDTPESDYGYWYHSIDAGTGCSYGGFCLSGIVGPQDAHLLAAAPDMKAEILHLRAQVETMRKSLQWIVDNGSFGHKDSIVRVAKEGLDDAISKAREAADAL